MNFITKYSTVFYLVIITLPHLCVLWYAWNTGKSLGESLEVVGSFFGLVAWPIVASLLLVLWHERERLMEKDKQD